MKNNLVLIEKVQRRFLTTVFSGNEVVNGFILALIQEEIATG